MVMFPRTTISSRTNGSVLKYMRNFKDFSIEVMCRRHHHAGVWSVFVGGEETAVRYWQDTSKGLVDQYLLEFLNGVKRTYIYTHLPANFCMDKMLAGLCNLCDDLATLIF